jgi:hypothetical protein
MNGDHALSAPPAGVLEGARQVLRAAAGELLELARGLACEQRVLDLVRLATATYGPPRPGGTAGAFFALVGAAYLYHRASQAAPALATLAADLDQAQEIDIDGLHAWLQAYPAESATWRVGAARNRVAEARDHLRAARDRFVHLRRQEPHTAAGEDDPVGRLWMATLLETVGRHHLDPALQGLDYLLAPEPEPTATGRVAAGPDLVLRQRDELLDLAAKLRAALAGLGAEEEKDRPLGPLLEGCLLPILSDLTQQLRGLLPTLLARAPTRAHLQARMAELARLLRRWATDLVELAMVARCERRGEGQPEHEAPAELALAGWLDDAVASLVCEHLAPAIATLEAGARASTEAVADPTDAAAVAKIVAEIDPLRGVALG